LDNHTTIKINKNQVSNLDVTLNLMPRFISPGNNEMVRAGMISINGTAPGPGFLNYELHYQPNGSSSWFNSGIVLTNGGTQPIVEGIIATFDASSIPDPQYVTLRLTVNQQAQARTEYIDIFVDPTLMDGWPVELNGFPIVQLNVARDQANEIKLIQQHHADCVQSVSGSNADNPNNFQDISIKRTVAGFENIKSNPIMDSDALSISNFNDGSNNIQGSDNIRAVCGGTVLNIFNSNGSFKTIDLLSDGSSTYSVPHMRLHSVYQDPINNRNYIPVMTDLHYYDYPPGLIDLDGNYYLKWPHDTDHAGQPIMVVDDKFFNIWFSYFSGETLLNGYHENGTLLDNFPINLTLDSRNDSIVIILPTLIESMNEKRIAVFAGGFNTAPDYFMEDLYLFMDIYSMSGTLINRVEIYNQTNNRSVDIRVLPIVAGDIDNDGASEILIGFSIIDVDMLINDHMNLDAYKTYYQIYDSNGQQLVEIPVKGYTVRRGIIADLGRSNREVVAALSDTWPTTNYGQKLLSFDINGNIIIDSNLTDYNYLIQGMVSGDVDNDNENEIVLNYRPRWYAGAHSGFLIYDKSGKLEKDMHKPTAGRADDYWGHDPILTDLDSDGIMDIIQMTLYLTYDDEFNTKIYAFTTGSQFQSDKLEWPIYMHDPQRTGLYSVPRIVQCGNNIREGSEECDGSDDAACPGQCLANCVCDATLRPPDFPNLTQPTSGARGGDHKISSH
jgi:hypothetical protein